MTPAQMKRVERRVDRLLKIWTKALGLEHWTFGVLFSLCEGEDETDNWAASIDPAWEYRTAQIVINGPVFLDCDDDEAEKYIVHELTHCLVSEIAPEGPDKLEEIAVTKITYALRNVRDLAKGNKI